MKFIPKVGEWCSARALPTAKWVLVEALKAEGEKVACVVLDTKQLYWFSEFKPYAENERDEAIETLARELGELCPLPEVVNKVIDLGYRKQQVKPLMTRSEFILICESERWANDVYEKVKGCTIQGGGK